MSPDKTPELYFFNLQTLEEAIDNILDFPHEDIKFVHPRDITPKKQPKRAYGDMDLFSRYEIGVSHFALGSLDIIGVKSEHVLGKILVDIGGDDYIGRYERVRLYLPRGIPRTEGVTPSRKIEIVGAADSQTPIYYARKDFVKCFGIWRSASEENIISTPMFGIKEGRE